MLTCIYFLYEIFHADTFETKFGASFFSQVIWLHVQQLLDDLFEKPELGDSWLPLASSIIGELLIPCAVWRASKVCHQHL
jgi:hypothetical protein